MPDEQGRLAIAAIRGGTIGEITSFLADLESAYVALYHASTLHPDLRRVRRRVPIEFLYELPYPWALPAPGAALDPFSVPPQDRLVVSRVVIRSPGFWEFLGSLNPLHQIREYLNDRHRRRQDVEFREASEKERLILENELIRRQLYEKDNAILRDRVEILRDLGHDDDEINRIIWSGIGVPLSRLGKHQDTKLIGDGNGDSNGRDAA